MVGKMGDTHLDEPECKLVNFCNRSGLWKVTKNIVEIFCPRKSYFRKYISKSTTRIDSKHIVASFLQDLVLFFNLFEINKENFE